MNINELPVEILVRIFSALRDETAHIWRCAEPWTVVTHVCRRWRSVALEAAELWTKIYAGPDVVVSAYVQRSKQAPLDINYADNVSMWDILAPQSHRIRSIAASVNNAVYPFFQHLLSHGAPLLVFAEPHFSPMLGEGQTRITDHETHRRGFPALRNLSLYRWPNIGIPSLSTLVVPSLRTLAIHSPRQRFSPSVCTSVLQNLPLLEELVLSYALTPLSSPSEHRIMPTIRLPRLIVLKITDDHPDRLVMLLRRIQPARNARIIFRVDPPPHHDALDFPTAPFAQAMSEKYTTRSRDASSPTLLQLDLSTAVTSLGRRTELEVKLAATVGTTCPCPEDKPIDATPILDISLSVWRLSLDDVCRPICNMLSTVFPLSAVKTLSLSSDIQEIPKSWRNVFLQMNHLDTIFMVRYPYSRAVNDLVRMLAVSEIQPSDTGSAVSSHQILFPSLRLLSIQELDDPSINLDLLLKVLQSRRKVGHGISSIHLCPSQGENLAKLRPKLLECKRALECHVEYCVLDGEPTR